MNNNKNSKPNRPKNRPPRFNRNPPPKPSEGGSKGRSLPVSSQRHSPQQRPEDLNKKWDRLRDSYLQARKKYFEHYHRIEGQQRDKLENEYYEALNQLRRFEQLLQKNHRPLFARGVAQYKQDTEYSLNHTQDDVPTIPIPETIDFHITPHQQERGTYINDNEDTTGTMDDYYQFKSINPRQSEK